MPRLTQAMLDRVKAPARGQRFLRDAKVQGLALRISRGGAKSWVWEGRIRGRVRRITLGHHPALSLPRARTKALAMAAAVADGRDPAAERARERGELTFGVFAQTYLERHATPHKRSADQDKRMLSDVLPRQKEGDKEREPAPIPATWKNRRLSDISHAEVTQLHGRLQRDRGLYAANRVLALLRTMFNLAKRWGTLASDNPTTGVRMFREEKRDRFLAPHELKRTLAAIEQEADWRWKAYFKLSLLLGPRRSELLSARWVDIDLQTGIWRLPTTKAGRPHLLPLANPGPGDSRIAAKPRTVRMAVPIDRRRVRAPRRAEEGLAAHPEPRRHQGCSGPRPPSHVGILAGG